jgi:hypothetical protein
MGRDVLIKEKAKVTVKEEPAILRCNPDISGLSVHIEDRDKRTTNALQIVFNFFQVLGINPELRKTDAIPANTYVWASYKNIKNEEISISFSYYESPYSGVHRTLSVYCRLLQSRSS